MSRSYIQALRREEKPSSRSPKKRRRSSSAETVLESKDSEDGGDAQQSESDVEMEDGKQNEESDEGDDARQNDVEDDDARQNDVNDDDAKLDEMPESPGPVEVESPVEAKPLASPPKKKRRVSAEKTVTQAKAASRFQATSFEEKTLEVRSMQEQAQAVVEAKLEGKICLCS